MLGSHAGFSSFRGEAEETAELRDAPDKQERRRKKRRRRKRGSERGKEGGRDEADAQAMQDAKSQNETPKERISNTAEINGHQINNT